MRAPSSPSPVATSRRSKRLPCLPASPTGSRGVARHRRSSTHTPSPNLPRRANPRRVNGRHGFWLIAVARRAMAGKSRLLGIEVRLSHCLSDYAVKWNHGHNRGQQGVNRGIDGVAHALTFVRLLRGALERILLRTPSFDSCPSLNEDMNRTITRTGRAWPRFGWATSPRWWSSLATFASRSANGGSRGNFSPRVCRMRSLPISPRPPATG